MARCIPARGRLCVVLLLLLGVLSLSRAELVPAGGSTPVYETSNQNVLNHHADSAGYTPDSEASHVSSTTTSALQDMQNALATLQTSFFSLWLGKYTSAIDWTAAVTSTHVSATLSSLSRSANSTKPLAVESENEINQYFAQLTAYYFGEDHFALRMQAFDDMLWVVLGWLETITFITTHSTQHYTSSPSSAPEAGAWHAQQFIPAFAHRARVFYDLAQKGWDWRLCGGGMTWNPHLLPYKNAITNQLFITASASMYLRFPGDTNCSPFISTTHSNDDIGCSAPAGPFNPTYLTNAVNGYTWLNASGMRNEAGLYTDGFHIRGYRTNHSETTCDERNEMLYTYNQGVILSGLRDLWESTGQRAYLSDAYHLIRAVVRATGWPRPSTPSHTQPTTPTPLGTNGILAEQCDPTASCNQDAHAFKGIFFHHLTAFCAPLPRARAYPRTYAADAPTADAHASECDAIADWVVWNARAALRTRVHGRFGGAWGDAGAVCDDEVHGVDYRNYPHLIRELDINVEEDGDGDGGVEAHDVPRRVAARDNNDRGRGRTVETQGSGLAVVRAMWEFLRWREDGRGGMSTVAT